MSASATRPPSAAIDETSVHAAVDRIVLEFGAYLPIELLIDQGRLAYSAYEQWRSGSAATLDAGLHGSPARVQAILMVAAAWAERLGLEPQAARHEGWGAASTSPRRCADDTGLDALLSTCYVRRTSDLQTDLFFDGGEAAMLADVQSALASRHANLALERLESLVTRNPGYRLRPDLETLCDALNHFESGAVSPPPEVELTALDGPVATAAREVLGPRARDFLAPFWRRLAKQMEGRPFEPQSPRLHASFAYSRCLAWSDVQRCLRSEPALLDQPVLLLRLVEAGFCLRQRQAALCALAQLCWRHVEHAQRYLDDNQHADSMLQQVWEACADFDFMPALDARWFPACLVLHYAGLATPGLGLPPPVASEAGEAYLALEDLARHGTRENPGVNVVALRRRLQRAHPALFGAYLEMRGSGET